jgi:hypothetical protein
MDPPAELELVALTVAPLPLDAIGRSSNGRRAIDMRAAGVATGVGTASLRLRA